MSQELRPDVVAGKFNPELFDPTGQTLLVNEMFYSIQGEGQNAGEPALFLRLAKCNLACKFCDTEFETFRKLTVEQIVHSLLGLIANEGYNGQERPMVVITGGEPLIQNCAPLLLELVKEDFFIAVETSGSVFAEWVKLANWVTCSPKVKFLSIPEELLMRVSEFKWIVNDVFLRQVEREFTQCWVPGGAANYLQPEWGPQRERYTAAAVKLAKRHPSIYRLSLQTHKLMGVP